VEKCREKKTGKVTGESKSDKNHTQKKNRSDDCRLTERFATSCVRNSIWVLEKGGGQSERRKYLRLGSKPKSTEIFVKFCTIE